MNVKDSHYTLRCEECGQTYKDAFQQGFLLNCRNEHPPSLLKAQYRHADFDVQGNLPGLFRFAHWLPIRRLPKSAPFTAVYRSEGLARRLGLKNLWIAFNGYWPDRGAFMETGSFKELEAPPVCARIPEKERGTLVVSSAGNTARAFLKICSEQEIPAVVIVPEAGLSSLWMTQARHPKVRIIAVRDADYLDAILLGRKLAACPGFFAEGGVKNVARRDGLGTVLLAGVEAMKQIPQHYFQAIGSGTGGIAVWEMSQRLRMDARFETQTMRLHLSQNAPFTPIYDAWNAASRALFPGDEHTQKSTIQAIRAHVLSNRQPPYSIRGGVYDALVGSRGSTYAVTNDEAARAGAIFLHDEGCDLDPAAEVAVASLFQAVEQRTVEKNDSILLNVTGGGYNVLKQHKFLSAQQADLLLTLDEMKDEGLLEQIQRHIAE